jgi:hypothetical protein
MSFPDATTLSNTTMLMMMPTLTSHPRPLGQSVIEIVRTPRSSSLEDDPWFRSRRS